MAHFCISASQSFQFQTVEPEKKIIPTCLNICLSLLHGQTHTYITSYRIAACHLLQIMKRGLQRVGLPPPPPGPDNMALYELLLLCQHGGVEGEIILIWRA